MPKTTSPLSNDQFIIVFPFREFKWVRRYIVIFFTLTIIFSLFIDSNLSNIILLTVAGLISFGMASDGFLLVKKEIDEWILQQYYGSIFLIKLKSKSTKNLKVNYKITGKSKSSPVKVQFLEYNTEIMKVKTNNYFAKELQEALEIHDVDVLISKAPYLN